MGCSSCSTGKDGKPGGCQSKGSCSSGGCNRLNTFDWLTKLDIHDQGEYDVVEVSFKQGSRKAFYRNHPHTRAATGDVAVVETEAGYDIGHISLSGDLVRMQMRKKRVDDNSVVKSIIRRANQRDIERLDEARSIEHKTMVRARAISRMLDLDMKIGDVEYQGDKRKATFYYTADGRVDFRELIRHFAKEFKVKIEMRQIGARQESARIGGLGSCGRELCCSTWLSDFKTVSTTAARYQNLAINQAKLSGQCGRLKCCLNYELDTYLDALEDFPEHVDKLKTEAGIAVLVKTDIFKGLMYYAYLTPNGGRGKFYPLELDRVKEIQAMNLKGEFPTELVDLQSLISEEIEIDFESVNDVIELPMEQRRRRSRNRNRNKKRSNNKGGAAKKGDKNPETKNPENRRKFNKETDAKKGDRNNKRTDAKRTDKRDGKPPRNANNKPKDRRGRKEEGNKERDQKTGVKRERPQNKNRNSRPNKPKNPRDNATAKTAKDNKPATEKNTNKQDHKPKQEGRDDNRPKNNKRRRPNRNNRNKTNTATLEKPTTKKDSPKPQKGKAETKNPNKNKTAEGKPKVDPNKKKPNNRSRNNKPKPPQKKNDLWDD